MHVSMKFSENICSKFYYFCPDVGLAFVKINTLAILAPVIDGSEDTEGSN